MSTNTYDFFTDILVYGCSFEPFLPETSFLIFYQFLPETS